jgi:Arc/MetJ-type ribon-helix-helix transcriptional regulator
LIYHRTMNFVKTNSLPPLLPVRHERLQEKGLGDEEDSLRILTKRYDLWYYEFMSVAKITISIDENLLTRLDILVRSHIFSNRSQAVQSAVEEKIARLTRSRLAQECAKLDPLEEQSLAEEGLAAEAAEWPPY